MIKSEDLVECGCCGCYHRKNYVGDCRNDDERYLSNCPPITAAQSCVIDNNLEGLYNLSPVVDKEPDHSRVTCELCGSKLTAERYVFAARNHKVLAKGKIVTRTCCAACFEWLFG